MLSNHLPTVPQDSFYRYHTPEELALAHANLLDFDHPDALDMPMFAAVCAPSPRVLPLFLSVTRDSV